MEIQLNPSSKDPIQTFRKIIIRGFPIQIKNDISSDVTYSGEMWLEDGNISGVKFFAGEDDRHFNEYYCPQEVSKAYLKVEDFQRIKDSEQIFQEWEIEQMEMLYRDKKI